MTGSRLVSRKIRTSEDAHQQKIAVLARILDEATLRKQAIVRLTVEHPSLRLEDAYLIQDAGIRLRLGRGEKVVGFKMGLTSKAKMKQMGVDSPIYGVLTSSMRVENGSRLSLSGRIHPKIEPEVAFVVRRELHGRVSMEEALNACGGVCAAIEVIDSRFQNFDFTLPDVIADNGSSSAFVLGPLVQDFSALNLGNLGIILEVDRSPAQSGSSEAIYGHPGASLAELCSMLHARGLGLPSGSIVLSGAATQAVALKPGMSVRTCVQGLPDALLKAMPEGLSS